MALTARVAFIVVCCLFAPTLRAETTDTPASPPGLAPLATEPAAPFKPDDTTGPEPDMWIFSGILEGKSETFSGTLVSGKDESEFELRLGDGATCDGENFKGDVGMVRLSDIPCSDGRSMRALFIPQGGQLLRVFGRIGQERFIASAHLLGTEPPVEKKQTMQPTVPQIQPPDSEPPQVAPQQVAPPAPKP